MSKVNGGETKKPLHCTFCGKSQHEVRKLIFQGAAACNCSLPAAIPPC
jgi:ClpX C4-type zinc finger